MECLFRIWAYSCVSISSPFSFRSFSEITTNFIQLNGAISFWWVISVIPFPDGQGCYPLSASAYGSATIHYVKEEYNTQQINHQQHFTPCNGRYGSSFYSSSPIKISHKQKFFPSQQLLTDFHRFFHSHFHKGNGTGQYQYSQQSNTVKTMECFTAQQQAVK